MVHLPVPRAPVFHHTYVLISALGVHHNGDALLSAYVPGLLGEDVLDQMLGRDFVRCSCEVGRRLFVRCMAVGYVYPPFIQVVVLFIVFPPLRVGAYPPHLLLCILL